MIQPNFAKLRVLLVGPKGHAIANLRAVLDAAGITRIALAEEPHLALELLCTEGFEAVFVEGNVMSDGIPFALAARRCHTLLNPMVPVFVVYSRARKRDVEIARDLGAHDVIARPISPKTIMEKLGAAIVAPRPFIAAPEFFGPDRRARSRTFHGTDRRVRAPKKTKVQFYEVP